MVSRGPDSSCSPSELGGVFRESRRGLAERPIRRDQQSVAQPRARRYVGQTPTLREGPLMTLSDEYKRQFEWRSWGTIFDALPELGGRTVLDLGCGLGDQAAALASRGARVIGVDSDEALLAVARSAKIPNAEFRAGDFRELSGICTAVDGIWCSFAAAYTPDLSPTLMHWRQYIKPGGWIALTEIDELF